MPCFVVVVVLKIENTLEKSVATNLKLTLLYKKAIVKIQTI